MGHDRLPGLRLLERTARHHLALRLYLAAMPARVYLADRCVSETALSQIGCFLAAALGGLQKFYAMRVAFDQQLFAGWAKRWDAAADPEADLATLDATLIAVGLRATPAAASRPLADRIRGAFQLLKRQAVILALQFAALLIAAWSCLLPLATL